MLTSEYHVYQILSQLINMCLLIRFTCILLSSYNRQFNLLGCWFLHEHINWTFNNVRYDLQEVIDEHYRILDQYCYRNEELIEPIISKTITILLYLN